MYHFQDPNIWHFKSKRTKAMVEHAKEYSRSLVYSPIFSGSWISSFHLSCRYKKVVVLGNPINWGDLECNVLSVLKGVLSHPMKQNLMIYTKSTFKPHKLPYLQNTITTLTVEIFLQLMKKGILSHPVWEADDVLSVPVLGHPARPTLHGPPCPSH